MKPGGFRCPISYWAGEGPAYTALADHKGVLTYDELDRTVSRIAALLAQQGVGRGTRVALVGRNSSAYIAVLAALWRLAAVAVPLNFRFPRGYLEEIFRITGVTAAVLEPSLASAFPGIITPISWQEIASSGNKSDGHRNEIRDISLENEAAIIHTSGSTGQAKAVLHTYANYYYNALGSNENIPLEPGDRWLLSLPLFHVGGLGILFRCFLAGATVAIPPLSVCLGEIISRYGITHVSLVSTQLYRLLQESAMIPLSPLKALLLGGSAFPEPLLRQAVRLKLPVYTSYGLSEMASQVTTTPGNLGEKITTSGKVLAHRELKVKTGGEICVRGETLFKGYVHGTTVSRPLDREGWFHTGDLGEIDSQGYLHVLARCDNMFISGGENIVPEEIEQALHQFPGILEAVVVPVPDETYGNRPVAFLKFSSRETAGKAELVSFLEARLPRFKIPQAFYLWPQEMEGKSFKIQRSTLKEQLETVQQLRILT